MSRALLMSKCASNGLEENPSGHACKEIGVKAMVLWLKRTKKRIILLKRALFDVDVDKSVNTRIT